MTEHKEHDHGHEEHAKHGDGGEHHEEKKDAHEPTLAAKAEAKGHEVVDQAMEKYGTGFNSIINVGISAVQLGFKPFDLLFKTMQGTTDAIINKLEKMKK